MRSIEDSYRKKIVIKSRQAVSKIKKYIYAKTLKFLHLVNHEQKVRF